VLVEHLVDVVARQLLVGLELLGGGGHCPLLGVLPDRAGKGGARPVDPGLLRAV
jgi:hypothetical protein